VTILIVTVTTVIVVIKIHIVVVTLEIVTTKFWFAETILTNRFADATKSFSPCLPKETAL